MIEEKTKRMVLEALDDEYKAGGIMAKPRWTRSWTVWRWRRRKY
jgi:hypothetical protein